MTDSHRVAHSPAIILHFPEDLLDSGPRLHLGEQLESEQPVALAAPPLTFLLLAVNNWLAEGFSSLCFCPARQLSQTKKQLVLFKARHRKASIVRRAAELRRIMKHRSLVCRRKQGKKSKSGIIFVTQTRTKRTEHFIPTSFQHCCRLTSPCQRTWVAVAVECIHSVLKVQQPVKHTKQN